MYIPTLFNKIKSRKTEEIFNSSNININQDNFLKTEMIRLLNLSSSLQARNSVTLNLNHKKTLIIMILDIIRNLKNINNTRPNKIKITKLATTKKEKLLNYNLNLQLIILLYEMFPLNNDSLFKSKLIPSNSISRMKNRVVDQELHIMECKENKMKMALLLLQNNFKKFKKQKSRKNEILNKIKTSISKKKQREKMLQVNKIIYLNKIVISKRILKIIKKLMTAKLHKLMSTIFIYISKAKWFFQHHNQITN